MKKVVMYHGEIIENGKLRQLFKDRQGKAYSLKDIKFMCVGSCYFMETNYKKIFRKPVLVKNFKMTQEEQQTLKDNLVMVNAWRVSRLVKSYLE